MARKEKPTFVTEKDPFPQRLKELIEERGSTQTEIAKYVGCTRQAISLYVTGQSTPDINILLKLSEFFEVSADYLLGKAEEKTTDLTIKEICKYTGLSEKAVENLHIICMAELKRLLKTINFLIEEELVENGDYCITDGMMSVKPSGERFLNLFFSIAEFFSTSIDDDVELVIHRNDVGIVDKDSDWFERAFNVGSIKAKDIVDVAFMNSIRGKLMEAKEKYIAGETSNGKCNKEK